MPTPTKGPRLGGSPAHERIILANLASQLFEHGRITTTEARAKRVQPLAEKLITKAKRGDLHSRRIVLKTVTDQYVVKSLFEEIAPTFADRNGGYTRVTKIGNRKGDNAPLAVIELVTESVEEGRRNRPERKKATADDTKQAINAQAPAHAQAEDAAPADDAVAPKRAETEDAVEAPAQPAAEAGSDDQAPGDQKVIEAEAGESPAEAQADEQETAETEK